NAMVAALGPELSILTEVPIDDIGRHGGERVAEAVRRLRAGDVRREAGYDGEYGVIRLFDPDELRGDAGAATLFDVPDSPPAVPKPRVAAEPVKRRRTAADLAAHRTLTEPEPVEPELPEA